MQPRVRVRQGGAFASGQNVYFDPRNAQLRKVKPSNIAISRPPPSRWSHKARRGMPDTRSSDHVAGGACVARLRLYKWSKRSFRHTCLTAAQGETLQHRHLLDPTFKMESQSSQGHVRHAEVRSCGWRCLCGSVEPSQVVKTCILTHLPHSCAR
jgi:hypothetical protein